MKSLQPRLNKDALILKKTKETKRPDIYMSQSQKYLDKYFRQIESTFWSKPTIYASKKDKCIYAGKYLKKTLADNWVTINQTAKESDQGYSFEAFWEML